MTAFSYRPNHSGTAAWILGDAGIRRYLEQVGAEAQRYAESISPRASGEYASSFRVEPEVSFAETRTRRPTVRLVNDAPHAWAVENDHHVLSRTKDHIEATFGGGAGGDANDLVKYTTLAGKTRMATRAQAAAWMASRRG